MQVSLGARTGGCTGARCGQSRGMDTGTPVAFLEYRYELPFRFTGKLNKLTFDLGPVQLSSEDHKVVEHQNRQSLERENERNF